MTSAVRQPTLWDRDDTYQRFVRFHRRHPDVYERLLQLCHQWRARGRDQWSSMGALYVLRFDHRLRIDDPDESFKIQNDYAPWFSRLVMGLLPEIGPGHEDYWVCCEHPRIYHGADGCDECAALASIPRLLGARVIRPGHAYAAGIFELRELKKRGRP